MTSNSENHIPVFREIKLDAQPLTSSQKKVERKQKLKELIGKEFGKNLEKIRKKCEKERLLVKVDFRVMESEEKGRSKMDLDNLLKILMDVLEINMVNGQTPIAGLGIVRDDSQIYEIRCRKIPVTSQEEEGINLQISTFTKTEGKL